MIIDDIINGIGKMLKTNFPDIPNYYNEIEQEFKEPSFFLDVIHTSETQVLGPRYYREYDFDLRYFPPKNNNLALFKMIEYLHNLLDFITTKDGHLIRGVERRTEEVDGVLHYIFSIHVYVIKTDGKEKIFMKNVKTDQNTKGGVE